MTDKKFYWLRLKKDFFKRHDITIIESMPNGKDYVLFYLKLLAESVSHEGELRFNETIPYNADMLATITNTNADVVRSALNVFGELNLIEILDDETIFMTEVNKMIGSSTTDEHTRESTRERVKRFRERQKQLELEDKSLQKRYSNVTCNGEIELEIEKDNIYVSPEVDTKELEEEINKNFEIIYNLYPKKGTKASAKESYKKWIQKSGRKVGGKTYHLTNKQIWAAVKNYVDTQTAKGTEEQYYKNFVTLMNQLLDWVVDE